VDLGALVDARLHERADLVELRARILSSCARELIAPMSVFLSSGSPTRSVSMRRASFATTMSATGSWTSRREPAQHTCPWLK
jgi:hypothetical protein